MQALVAPGVVVSVCVLAGVATGVATPLAPAAALAAALVLVSLAVLEQPARLRRGLLITALVALSAAYGAHARERALAPPLVVWFDVEAPDGRLDVPVTVDGTLAADAAPSDAGVRLTIDARRIRTGGAWRATRGRIQVNVAGARAASVIDTWTRGRRIAAPVVLRRPQVWLNPGSADLTWQRLRQRSDLVGSIKSASLVDVAPGAWWEEAAAAVRRRVRAANARYLLPRGEQAAAIAAAILIGDRAGLSDDVERRLQAAGTYHVIAISGGNVALVAALCFWGLRAIVRSPRAGSLICMSVIAAYGVIVGGEASVSRAIFAACMYLAVGLAGLRPAGVNVLALVALVLVVADPLMVIDVGAWLSFGATLGIILWAGRIARWLTRWSAIGEQAAMATRVAYAFAKAALRLLAATLAAELMLLPVAAAVFARVSVAGLLCNFVAIPAMAVVQLASLAVVCLAAWPGAATWPAMAADLASRILINSAQIVDVAPWLSWRVPPPSLFVIALFYVGVLAVGSTGAWSARRPSVRTAALVAVVALAGVVLFAPTLERARPATGVLRITTLDVGQGDAILVQTPRHHAVLIDSGGTSGSFDIGGRIVVPAVWASGVRRLDWLTFTHPDIDHIGGALAVSEDLQPREIWEGIPVPPHPSRAALLEFARGHAMIWRQLLAGHVFEVDGVLFETRHPPPPDWERQRTRNDDSLVLRLRYGDVDVLLTGDAGVEFERREVATLEGEERPAPLRVLKVGHHGSLSSTSFPFLRALRPQIAIISAGRANLFGHPAPDIVARLEDSGAEVFRTDLDGAIVLETDGRRIWVRTMTGRQWQLETGSS